MQEVHWRLRLWYIQLAQIVISIYDKYNVNPLSYNKVLFIVHYPRTFMWAWLIIAWLIHKSEPFHYVFMKQTTLGIYESANTHMCTHKRFINLLLLKVWSLINERKSQSKLVGQQLFINTKKWHSLHTHLTPYTSTYAHTYIHISTNLSDFVWHFINAICATTNFDAN